jgi:hypothetical protein
MKSHCSSESQIVKQCSKSRWPEVWLERRKWKILSLQYQNWLNIREAAWKYLIHVRQRQRLKWIVIGTADGWVWLEPEVVTGRILSDCQASRSLCLLPDRLPSRLLVVESSLESSCTGSRNRPDFKSYNIRTAITNIEVLSYSLSFYQTTSQVWDVMRIGYNWC